MGFVVGAGDGRRGYHDDVERTTKGERITRHGTDDNPAYVIRQDDGTVVLKLASEVERADGD